ncbi:hypothetical protein CDCA_CDCA08G2374 [Cyanidium caldarium]|uniref:Citrate transporter-like domain-containing protein n=1 Tax=Cyanidium caldarium TaxID=2771 RepID=A0AAV9IVN6_CYACA|nr:hypothetical protein CDCA_CDCA08G2374 [Cyanidium caldarium]
MIIELAYRRRLRRSRFGIAFVVPSLRRGGSAGDNHCSTSFVSPWRNPRATFRRARHQGTSRLCSSTESERQSSKSREDTSVDGTAVSTNGRGLAPPPPRSSTAPGRESTTHDVRRTAALVSALLLLALSIREEWIEHNVQVALWILFGVGYTGIVLEDVLQFHKTGAALLMAVAMWTALAVAQPASTNAAPVLAQLSETLSGVAPLLFFLLGAMSIVEIIDSHRGFRIVTDYIRTRNPRLLLWLLSAVTFFMSAVLDNLTTTIVMVSVARQLVPRAYRRLIGAAIVVAANCGGVATPLGDVTTTMLWIGGQISTLATVSDLLLPSLMSLLVSVAVLTPALPTEPQLETHVEERGATDGQPTSTPRLAPRGRLVFVAGVGALLFVPAFKALTGLPPYMGMLSGLGFMWLLTDLLHAGEPERVNLRAPSALSRVDQSSILFFLGILMSVGALESAGALTDLAQRLDAVIGSREWIATIIGLVSSVIDNVPLVAATMGMYDLQAYPRDSPLWQLIAYCAGTGGSILIIGSAAGVAFMGMEKVDFFWYLRHASLSALAGYAAGIAAYLALHSPAVSHWIGGVLGAS